jgi:DNA primase
MIRQFEIGYCPATAEHDLAGRIIMPLYNAAGTELVAFTTRNPDAPKQFQHWHESFDKSSYLYGLNIAKDAIRKQDKAIIVEGQFDTICSHTFGLNMTVGLCGTSLTIRHVYQLARYCSEVYFMLDPDPSGDSAVNRAMQISEKFCLDAIGIRFYHVKLPDDYDPDDFIRKFGVNEVVKLLRKAKERNG